MMASEKYNALDDIHFVDGICWPTWVSEDYVKDIKKLTLNETDVVVTGYPRSGNTWTATTVDAIHRADDLDQFEKEGAQTHIFDLAGWPDEIQQMASPRVFWSHVRYHQLPEDIQKKDVKVIHTNRDPRDAAVSYYRLYQTMTKTRYEGTWETFFNAFMEGRVWYGTWFDYTKDWNSFKNHPHILHIEYEDFLNDRKGMVKKIAVFLGKTLSEDQVERIASIVEFNAMKRNPKFHQMDHESLDASRGEFIRSGKTGDWKNYFTSEQKKIFNAAYEKFCEDVKTV